MVDKDRVVVRYAPSPTGYMHIGTLRTLLYDYLFAKQNDGKIILRIEDTDQSRKVEGSVENLEDLISWAGIDYDSGPFFQSERVKKGIYDKYVQLLLDNGYAYKCFCTPERLDEMRQRQRNEKKPPMYDRMCRNLSDEQVKEKVNKGEKFVIRFKIPENKIVEFNDVVRGNISINSDTIDDFVLVKSDGYPTYHLASVVDDYEMDITHVIRGEEWVVSTPKHVLLYEAFGWDLPEFVHLPLLLNAENKKKLSKRQGDVAVEDFIKKGYLKEAIINFVALLGWNPGKGSTKEIFSIEELISEFDLKKVNKSGAVFDIKRLNWINQYYIKNMPIDELIERVRLFWKRNYPEFDDEEFMKKVVVVEQDRLEYLSQIGKNNPFFFEEFELDKELLRWKDASYDYTKKQLEKAVSVLSDISEDEWTRDNLTNVLMQAAGDKRGDFLWPIRAALTGVKKSPSPMDCAWVLGKKKTLDRINRALDLF